MLRGIIAGVNRLFSRKTKSGSKKFQEGQSLVLLKVIDGRWLELHTSDNAEVQIVNVPRVSPQNQHLLDQLIDEALPERFRHLNVPGTIKATGQVERLTASDLLERVTQVTLFDALAFSRPDSERVTGQQAVQSALGVTR